MGALEDKANDKGYLGRMAKYLRGEPKPKKEKEKEKKTCGLMNTNQRKLLDMVDG